MNQRLRPSGIDTTETTRHVSEPRQNDRQIRPGSRCEERDCRLSSPHRSPASNLHQRFDADDDNDRPQRHQQQSNGFVHDTSPSFHPSASRSQPCRGRRDNDVNHFSTDAGMNRNGPDDNEMIASLVGRRRRSIGQDSSLVPLVHISPYLNKPRRLCFTGPTKSDREKCL